MDRIHLMMPMAGGGVRFEKEGFEIPKPLIQIAEKPFLLGSQVSNKIC